MFRTHLHEPKQPRFGGIELRPHLEPGVLPVHHGAEALEGKPGGGIHPEEAGLGDEADAPDARLCKGHAFHVRLQVVLDAGKDLHKILARATRTGEGGLIVFFACS